jgi:hypothetical protein
MERLEHDLDGIPRRLGCVGLGVQVCQRGDEEGPADEPEELDRPCQHADGGTDHQVPGNIWREYLLNHDWDRSEQNG